MTAGKKRRERRKEQRFKVKDCSIVAGAKFGEVIDISVAGVGFTYIDQQGIVAGSEGRVMLVGDDDLFIDDLPVGFISDTAIGSGVSVVRRCGARFGKLSAKQLRLIEQLIKRSLQHEEPNDGFSA